MITHSILYPFILLFDFVLSVPTGWLGSIVPAALLTLGLYLMAVLVTAVIVLIQHAIVWKRSWRWSWDAATTVFKPILLVFLVVGVFLDYLYLEYRDDCVWKRYDKPFEVYLKEWFQDFKEEHFGEKKHLSIVHSSPSSDSSSSSERSESSYSGSHVSGSSSHRSSSDYERGYAAGYEAGFEEDIYDGYDHSDDYDDGYSEGYYDGYSDGGSDGFWDDY